MGTVFTPEAVFFHSNSTRLPYEKHREQMPVAPFLSSVPCLRVHHQETPHPHAWTSPEWGNWTRCRGHTFFFFGHGMWDLTFPLEIEPVPPAVEAWSLTHWTTREVQCRRCFWLSFSGSFIPRSLTPAVDEHKQKSLWIWMLSSWESILYWLLQSRVKFTWAFFFWLLLPQVATSPPGRGEKLRL